MPQEYDTTGKDILNEQINEIAQFVLNVPEALMQESPSRFA